MSSAKGHEYFLKHYLGTHNNAIAKTCAPRGRPRSVAWHATRREGKLDLISRPELPDGYVGALLRHRPSGRNLVREGRSQLDRPAQRSSIRSRRRHRHAWESKSGLADLFRAIAKKTSELAVRHFPAPGRGSGHDAAGPRHPGRDRAAVDSRLDQGRVRGHPGQDDARDFKVVTRDYRRIGNSVSRRWDPRFAKAGSARMDVLARRRRTVRRARRAGSDRGDGKARRFRSIAEAQEAEDAILTFATETNGEVAYRGYQFMEEKTGMPLVDLAEGSRVVASQLSATYRRSPAGF